MVSTATVARLVEADPEDVGISSAGMRKLSRLVQTYVDSGRMAGATSAVVRHGKVVHFETYGMMDVAAARPMTADAVFRIYSMTKPIVSIGLMTLYEEGRFMLDDPASKYIPQFKGLRVAIPGSTPDHYATREPAREMTVRDLLMHTSGLVAPAGGVVVSTSPVAELYRRAGISSSPETATLADMVNKLGEMPLKCDPGSEWNYGISTDVVGYLCELFSGQRLDDFLQERILGRLGMVDTGFHAAEAQRDRLAAHYRYVSEGKFEPVDESTGRNYLRAPSYLSGAGGMVSTTADYIRFTKMLANGGELDGARIIGPRTLRLMATNHLLDGRDLGAMSSQGPTETAREGIGFGLGFAVLMDQARAQMVGSVGEYYWGGAASTAFWVSPADDLSVVFMTQLMPSSSYPIRREMRAVVYGALND